MSMQEISRPAFALLIDDIAARLSLTRSEVLDRIRHACDRRRQFFADLASDMAARAANEAAREKRVAEFAAARAALRERDAAGTQGATGVRQPTEDEILWGKGVAAELRLP
jgi:hypothetical protein